MDVFKLSLSLFLVVAANIALSQVNTFPYSESFEQTFTTGDNVVFITHWTGNTVRTSNRISQGTDAHSGTSSLHAIPTSSFNAEILISLDLTGINNPILEFYAFSKQNGSATSTRPALLSFAASIDGGKSFIDNVRIGDETTFPNNDESRYTLYEYNLPAAASGQSNVIIKITVSRGSGIGSAAELVMDDVTISEQTSAVPLAISTATANSATEIQMSFNQAIDPASATIASNYVLDFGFGSPISAAVSSSNIDLVTLTFENALVNNTYTLTVNDVSNVSGSSLASNLSTDITYNTITHSRQIVINEIYADPNGPGQPDPQVLPGSSSDEFIELYNASSKHIDIGNFDLSGGTIGHFVLAPGAHVILTSSSNVSDFEAFGDVIAVNSWNALTNTGEPLILKDNLGNIVDSLTYDLSWYQNNDKSEGGWSLEQLNPELICSDAHNWTASNNVSGGSPGTQNSVFDITPDTEKPKFIAIESQSPTELKVIFNEIMDQSSLFTGTFVLDNGIEVDNSAAITPGLKSIILTLSSALISGTVYTLTISGLTDCAGNTLASSSISFLFDNLPPAFERFVVKDNQTIDLLFDEDLDENQAETESNFSLDQSVGTPEQAILDDTDPSRLRLSFAQALRPNTDYLLAYDHLTDTLGNTTGPSHEPINFSDAVDTIMVVSAQLLDVYFTEPIQTSTAEIVANYTVDGGIGSPKTALRDNDNLQLVHLLFEESFDDNTELTLSFENIKNEHDQFLQALNGIFVYDTDRPGIDSVSVVNENTLLVYFDEAVDLTSSEAINNYSVNHGIDHPVSATRQVGKRSVRLVFSTSFVNELEHSISVQDIKDLSGNKLSSTRKIDFIYDSLAPRLISLKLLGPTEIELGFSESLAPGIAETHTNYTVDNGIGNPLAARLSARCDHVVILKFVSLGNNAHNTMTMANIADNHGNRIEPEIATSFATNQAVMSRITVLTDSTIQVQFSKTLDKTSAETLSSYNFDNGPTASAALLSSTDASLVTIIFSDRLAEDVNYSISIASLEDTDGNISTNLREVFSYDSQLSAWAILNENTLELTFENTLEPISTATTVHYNLVGIGSPVSAVLNSDDQLTVTLIFADDFIQGTNYTLTIAKLKDSFGDHIPASIHAVRYDTTPPEVQSVESTFTNQITVIFNEYLEQTSAETLNHYSLNNDMGQPTAVNLLADGNAVLLTFDLELIDSIRYTLTLDRVTDLNGNAVDNKTIDFTFTAPFNPEFRDLVINEIYPDPDANSSLPNAEFVEIFNAGVNPIKLKDFILTDNSVTAMLLPFELAAGGFLILTSSTNEGLFSGLGNVMGLSNFPSLSNNGETLVLKRRDGQTVDSLRYDLSFYNDEAKQDGGYSIELINPQAHCFDSFNYAASTSPNQGTPGAPNAVFNNDPDTVPPWLRSVEIINDTQIELVFNESMDISSIQTTDFSLSNGLIVDSVEFLNSFGEHLRLNLSNAISRGTAFSLTISDVTDCSGNEMDPVTETFALGARPLPGQLIITEIMANPSPSQGLPEVEYIEVLNISDQIVDLQGLSLSDRSSSTPIPSFNIRPGEYALLTTSIGELQLNGSLGVAGFPNLNSSGDLVAISHGTDLIVSVNYDQSWFRNSEKANGGFSLEMIDITFPCLEATNWNGTSAANGGTPGSINSVAANNPDLIGPKMLEAVALNDLQVMLTYDEKIETATITASSFQISNGITVSSFSIDETQRIITLTLNSALQTNTLYTLSTGNITDCSGNLIMDGFSSQDLVIAVEASSGDVLINEILFNPRSNGVRFVELYNNSPNFVNLKDWHLAGSSNERVITEEQLIMNPGEYIVLSTDAQILASEYPRTIVETVFEMASLPSFPNTSGTVAIFNATGEQIDLFNYQADFHSNLLDNVDGVSLERIRFSGTTNDPNNWLSASSTVGFATPGYANSQSQSVSIPASTLSIEPPVFAPDIAGVANFTTINFEFDSPGNVLNVKIYDSGGNMVKKIAQNALVGTSGFFRWDGTNEHGTKARVGYYMILFEVFSPNGNISIIKGRAVVATHL